MSFALTADAVKERRKTVTRRIGWKNLRAGERLLAVSKTMGLRRGEKADVYGVIEVVSVRRESLDAIDRAEVEREGFASRGPSWFIPMFCASHKGCISDTEVTRIEFRYVDEAVRA